MPSHRRATHPAARRLLALSLAVGLTAAACSAATAATTPAPAASSDAATSPAGDALFDDSIVHEVALSFDGQAYDAMIDVYAATGEKEWIEATVTIDGSTYERAGVRLKGNSSLMGLRGDRSGPGTGGAVSAGDPQLLPWLVRLDEYVAGQNHDGIFDLVVRSNATATALNEAVALELIDLAGLASQDAVAARFRVNGGTAVLRLVTEHPEDVWMAEEFDADGALYKAESTGDYSYRGDDPDAYDEVFDQEAGAGNADLLPLVEFLEFINTADDDTFGAELPDHLDVEAFATYLAVQELIGNFDDIDGPGNNSYLYYDPATGMFTVVAWDHNLAFGRFGAGGRSPAGDPRGGLPGGAPGAGEPFGLPPAGGELPVLPSDGEDAPATPRGGNAPPLGGDDRGAPAGFDRPGGMGGSNILAERFLAVPEFEALYEQRLEELAGILYESGAADSVLSRWVALLESQGADLVDEATITSEAESIASYFVVADDR